VETQRENKAGQKKLVLMGFNEKNLNVKRGLDQGGERRQRKPSVCSGRMISTTKKRKGGGKSENIYFGGEKKRGKSFLLYMV